MCYDLCYEYLFYKNFFSKTRWLWIQSKKGPKNATLLYLSSNVKMDGHASFFTYRQGKKLLSPDIRTVFVFITPSTKNTFTAYFFSILLANRLWMAWTVFLFIQNIFNFHTFHTRLFLQKIFFWRFCRILLMYCTVEPPVKGKVLADFLPQSF